MSRVVVVETDCGLVDVPSNEFVGVVIEAATSEAPPAVGVQSIQPMFPGPFEQNGRASGLFGPKGQSCDEPPYSGRIRRFDPPPVSHCSSMIGKVSGISPFAEIVFTKPVRAVAAADAVKFVKPSAPAK
jgi:hypothetical protein